MNERYKSEAEKETEILTTCNIGTLSINCN